MYVAPGDESNELAQLMWNNLVGIMYLRTAGDSDEWQAVLNLASTFKRLGADVPVFKVNGEVIEKCNYWDPARKVNLLDPEYDLVEINLEEELSPKEEDDGIRRANQLPHNESDVTMV